MKYMKHWKREINCIQSFLIDSVVHNNLQGSTVLRFMHNIHVYVFVCYNKIPNNDDTYICILLLKYSN